MKNITFYKNCLKKGFALMSAVVCIGSFAGCDENGWSSDNQGKIDSTITEYKNKNIDEVFSKEFTFADAKDALLRKGINLTDDEIYIYLDQYKGANPENDPEYVNQRKLEKSIEEQRELEKSIKQRKKNM